MMSSQVNRVSFALSILLVIMVAQVDSALGQSYTFSLPSQAEPGDMAVVVDVLGDASVDLSGYSLVVVFDPAVFEPSADFLIEEGTPMETAELVTPGSTASDMRAGVVFSFSCPPSIAPGSQTYAKFRLDVKADAPTGPTTLLLQDVDPALNRMSPCTGTAITPTLDSQTINIGAAPVELAIDTTAPVCPLPDGTVDTAYPGGSQFTATGGTAPYGWSQTGLPTGMDIDVTGTITGTPTASGTFSFTVTVTDQVAATDTRDCSVTIHGAPVDLAVDTTAPVCPLPNGTEGVAYPGGSQFTATGGTSPYGWSQTGLPTGMDIDATGTITGTPTASGTFSFTVTVTDQVAATDTRDCSVTVDPVVGATGSYTFSLPSDAERGDTGVAVDVLGDASVDLSGYSLVVVFDPAVFEPSGDFLIEEGTPMETAELVTPGSTASDVRAGVVFSFSCPPSIAPGSQTYAKFRLDVKADAPTGPTTLLLQDVDPALNRMSPCTGTAITPTLDSQTINIGAAPVELAIDTTAPVCPLPDGTVDTAYPGGSQFTATGGTAPYGWSQTGLPTGMDIDVTGTITGTPTASGTFSFTVTVTDQVAATDTRDCSVTIHGAPVDLAIDTTAPVCPLPNGTEGAAYPGGSQFTATGGTSPYGWSQTGLPTGMDIDATGTITGTPTASGTFSFTVTVTDQVAATDTRDCSVTVDPVVGATGSYTFSLPSDAERGDTGVAVDVLGDASVDLSGYSLVVVFDPAVFEPSGDFLIEEGTPMETAELVTPGSTASDVRAGVVFSFSCPPSIAAGSQTYAKFRLDVKADAPTGPTTLLLQDVDPALNRMSPCTGTAITPTLDSQTINIGGVEPRMFKTFGQGFYGNYGGKYNGMSTLALLESLIRETSPLTVGMPGRSLTFGNAAAECIIYRLPAGGPPAALPADLGDALVDPSDCSTEPEVPLMNRRSSRYRNVLLGQTITLALNIRLNMGMENAPICLDTYMNPEVREAMETLGLPHTVGGVFELANRALAGHALAGASRGEINSTVDHINSHFQPCNSYQMNAQPRQNNYPIVMRQNAPNPFNPQTSISITSLEAQDASLLVFDASGRLVRTIWSGHMTPGDYRFVWDGRNESGERVRSGVYFYTLVAGDHRITKRLTFLP